jgi:hypothetical protein
MSPPNAVAGDELSNWVVSSVTISEKGTRTGDTFLVVDWYSRELMEQWKGETYATKAWGPSARSCRR